MAGIAWLFLSIFIHDLVRDRPPGQWGLFGDWLEVYGTAFALLVWLVPVVVLARWLIQLFAFSIGWLHRRWITRPALPYSSSTDVDRSRPLPTPLMTQRPSPDGLTSGQGRDPKLVAEDIVAMASEIDRAILALSQIVISGSEELGQARQLVHDGMQKYFKTVRAVPAAPHPPQ
jgi:hypothetical protein